MLKKEDIRIELCSQKKPKPVNQSELGFGKYYTDHMFIMNYDKGIGWNNPRIVPYQNISLDPAAMVFHYAQEVFEGLKAYRNPKGEIQLFRPSENFKRLNVTNERMCIPEIPEEFALEALKKLIRIEADWVPSAEGTSLYIRPFVIAIDSHIGVKPAEHYLFMIILSPVGAYYPEGLNPVKIYVETEYVRASRGGTGHVKTGANYAASLRAQAKAEEKSFTQVLWLDAVERRYIEEVGTMNVFFKIGSEIITPALGGSILPGITRKSCIELLRDWGYTVKEEKISIQELYEYSQQQKLDEAFGTGTAAVISPIDYMVWGDKEIFINPGKIGELSMRLYNELTGIQSGRIEDRFNWIVKI